jgi:nucleoside-diphosphate-sugar epimerase
MAKRLNLVTGACGFSGSHLVKHLLDQGEKVIATDLAGAFESERNRLIFDHIGLDLGHENLTVVPSDLTQADTIEPLFKRRVTHVFHTASLYNYSAPMDLLVKVNIGGFKNLLTFAEQAKLQRFVHWSTCGVFGHPRRLS